jgi:hypothetical protein
MFCTKVFKKIKLATLIFLSSLCFYNAASAMRASDISSPLEYVCFPCGITAWIRESGLEDWECARLKFLPNKELLIKLSRNGWQGRIVLPMLTEFLNSSFNLVGPTGEKLIILSQLKIVTEVEKVIDCEFVCECESQIYRFEFSSQKKEVKLYKNGVLQKKFELHEEKNECWYAPVIGLGLSMIVGEVV